ncbi:hypothetical protein ACIA5H_36290 [Nocardia sp. NPDC051900]
MANPPLAEYWREPDMSVHEVSVDDFDVLVVPGGTVNLLGLVDASV